MIGDSLGEVPFKLAEALHWSHDQVLDLTYAQLRYYAGGGQEPRSATAKTFESVEEFEQFKRESGLCSS